MLIKIKDVDIEIPDGPLGIKCSGGADSSLLLYILMLNTKNPIHVFTGGFGDNHRATARHSFQVIDKCIELTKNSNVFQHVIYLDYGLQKPINLMALEILFKYNLKLLYTGLNCNPPLDVMKTFKSDPAMGREDTIEKSSFILNSRFYKPFININKQKIKDMYVELGILESLFPLTRSCSSRSIYEGHCKECWWCEERYWGFSRYE